jgi:ABC-type lipoprotein release transport system permease subunit
MGAAPCDILMLVFAQGLRPVILGLLVGVPAALGVGHILRIARIEVSSTHTVTFTGVVLVLAAACILSCTILARRAVRVHPVIALRFD